MVEGTKLTWDLAVTKNGVGEIVGRLDKGYRLEGRPNIGDTEGRRLRESAGLAIDHV